MTIRLSASPWAEVHTARSTCCGLAFALDEASDAHHATLMLPDLLAPEDSCASLSFWLKNFLLVGFPHFTGQWLLGTVLLVHLLSRTRP